MSVSVKPLIEVSGHDFQPETHPPYVNLDNAATTPAAKCAVEAIESMLPFYGSIHRGSGLKSVISTELYEGAFRVVRDFIGADEQDAILLAWNTTTAINRFAMSYGFSPDDTVIISEVEHSSNDLPWRSYAQVDHCRLTQDGEVDLELLEECLTMKARKPPRLVAVTGASNVTGYLPPIGDIARLAHTHGAELFVDAAQLVAHRRIRIRDAPRAACPDYIAFSGHKMYAPFGIGVVAGRKHGFDQDEAAKPPDFPGGGTVDMVTKDDQIWSPGPARFTPGTPNVVGLVATAVAMKMIQDLDAEAILEHEARLVQTGLDVLESIPGVTLHGQSAFRPGADRLPIFPFTVEDYPHGLIAAILGHEYGVAVRQGHLCQYEFMRRELAVSQEEQAHIERDLRKGDKSSLYGMVRASAGLCSAESDFIALGDALRQIIKHGPTLDYRQERATGEFIPTGFSQENELKACLPEGLHFLLNQANNG